MPNLSSTAPNLRSLLESLPNKGRLFDVARHFGFSVPPKGTKVDPSATLASSPQLSGRALIGWMGRDELRVVGQRQPKPQRTNAGTLVIQPGPERRRTSNHYTPLELTEPIVERTLEPLIRAMGETPASEALLNLVVCDPAMGSGAFLVAACRYLADHVVAAWTREGRLEVIADAHDDVVNHARRLVAQRCLYGVDNNNYAVQLARLSLWLITIAREEPFSFVDHALRHGDSLVGLNFDQLRAFHWKPDNQVETSATLLKEALDCEIGVPPYCQKNDSESAAVKDLEGEPIVRLVVLKTERTAHERTATNSTVTPAARARAKQASGSVSKVPMKVANKKSTKKTTEGLGSLF